MILLNPHLFPVFATTGWVRSLFELNLDTFVQMIGPNLFNFVLVVLFLTFMLHKPVKKLLAARAERVFNELQNAELSNLSAQELKTLYEKKVTDIESERAQILDEARKVAKDRQSQILADAKAEAVEVKEKAMREIATEKERIKGAVFESIVDISTLMAERLISVNIDKTSHDRLFAEAMEELESTTFSKDSVTA
jgi:F-type H+-transporting ATPase subunit b